MFLTVLYTAIPTWNVIHYFLAYVVNFLLLSPGCNLVGSERVVIYLCLERLFRELLSNGWMDPIMMSSK